MTSNDTTAWFEKNTGYEPTVLNVVCPRVRDDADRRRAYIQAKNAGEPFASVQPHGDKFELTVDLEAQAEGNGLEQADEDLWNDLVAAVRLSKRVDGWDGARSRWHLYGVRTAVEAQVLGAIALELNAGNRDGAIGCVNALADAGFSGELALDWA